MKSTSAESPAPLGRSWFGRWWRVALLSFLAAACTSDLPRKAPDAPEPPRVLIVVSSRPPVIEQITRLLAAGGEGVGALPPMATDIIVETEPHKLTQALLNPPQPLERYRAIYTRSITTARLIQRVTQRVPIVFEGVDDAVVRCVIDSLERPGRNATGYQHYLPGDDLKMLEQLRDAYPGLREVWVPLAHDNSAPSGCDNDDPYWTQPDREPCSFGERAPDAYVGRRVAADHIAEHAARLGLRAHFVVLCKKEDLSRLHTLAQGRPGGWLVPWQGLFDINRRLTLDGIAATRMPAIYPNHRYTNEGGLMSLAAILDDGADRVSVLALQRVLGGADPATLPVQTPRGFTLQINGSAATQLPVRPTLMALRRADVILP